MKRSRSILFLTVPVLLIIFILSPWAGATTYTVDASGGGNFTTIQACIKAMSTSGGDTCKVNAGTYPEHPILKAGTAGTGKWDQTHANIVTVNAGDTVKVLGFTMASHTTVNGFNVTNPSSPASAACFDIPGNTTNFSITNNTMYACGTSGMVTEHTNYASTGYGHISGNKMSYACSTSSAPNVCEGLIINGDFHLIEKNDISHVSDGVTLFGTHNIFRKNTFHDVTTSDCGSHSSNCHIDFIESEPATSGGLTRPGQYNVYESNVLRNNVGGNAHAFLTQADSCENQCYNTIIRFNNLAHVGTFGIIDDNAGSTSVNGYQYIKSYNNDWIDFDNSSAQMAVNGFQHNSTHGASINDLFYFPRSVNYVSPYYVDSTALNGFTEGGNLAWCTGTCSFANRSNSGAFTNSSIGNIVADPKFVSYSTNDFTLATGSPALGTGIHLTTATSCSGSTLTVADASFFQDGYGIVDADWVRVGSSTTAQIASIDYSKNVITLLTSASCSSGDPIYLYKDSSGTVQLNGAKPDIGALQHGNGVDPPDGLNAVVQ